nr:glutamate receptor ionotropic, kainate 4-like [Rhipicephalus microplus]
MMRTQEADLAIGDLTITVSHSRVVDFTLPFMHTGIGNSGRVHKTHCDQLVGVLAYQVSFYTANMAAFLVNEKLQFPIENVHDLAAQSKIKYGCMSSGSTETF